MMVRDGDGFWTGDVKCDHDGCSVTLTREQIHAPAHIAEKLKETPQTLLERGWQCVVGRHYCPDHHKAVEDLGEEATKYIENWKARLGAYRGSRHDTSVLP